MRALTDDYWAERPEVLIINQFGFVRWRGVLFVRHMRALRLR